MAILIFIQFTPFYAFLCLQTHTAHTKTDIDANFKDYLRKLAPLLLRKENLQIKKINGTPLTGRGLLECFKVRERRGGGAGCI